MLTRKTAGFALLFILAALTVGASSVQQVDGDRLKKELARRKGKVVVLNLWATWCAPCREEFPALVKLHNSYRNKGVEVITVSVDVLSAEKEVVAFLQQQKAKMPSFIKKPGNDETFINAVDTEWRGAIPYTVVYDRRGKPFARLIGDHSYKEFESVVKKALAKRK